MYVCVAVLLSAPEADTERISAANTANAPSAPHDRNRMCVSPLYRIEPPEQAARTPQARQILVAKSTTRKSDAACARSCQRPRRTGPLAEPDLAKLRRDALHDHVTRADEHVRVGADLDVAQEHAAAYRRRICGHGA